MKHFSAFKLAAYLLLLYFMGHTFGGMLSETSMGPASDQVLEAMKKVHFDFNGADSTWHGFWLGFGLMTSVYLLFSALLAWQLDRIPAQHFQLLAPIAWGLVAAHAVTTALSALYFFAGPVAFGTLVTLLLATGAVRKSRPTSAPR